MSSEVISTLVVNGLPTTKLSKNLSPNDLVTASIPFTTSVEITSEDKFLILACDGLWDVIDDQDACELIKDITEPNEAAKVLVRYALENGTTDNVTVMVVFL